MTTTTAMLDTYPKPIDLDHRQLAATIDVLTACAETCTSCADACLGEDMVADLTKCIGTNLDCADICGTAARVLSRRTGYDATTTRALPQACIAACRDGQGPAATPPFTAGWEPAVVAVRGTGGGSGFAGGCRTTRPRAQ